MAAEVGCGVAVAAARCRRTGLDRLFPFFSSCFSCYYDGSSFVSLSIAVYRRVSLRNAVVDAPTRSVTGKKQRCRMFPQGPCRSSSRSLLRLLIFLSVSSCSEWLLRVLRALRSPHTRCSFPQTASVGRRVKVGEREKKKKRKLPCRAGNPVGLVISTNALPPEGKKKEPWGPLLVDRAPYFFRDSRQLELGQETDGQTEHGMGRWADAGGFDLADDLLDAAAPGSRRLN